MNPIVELILFAGFFVGMWLYVAYRVANGGWNDLALKYHAPRPPYGQKAGAVTGRFPRASYSSSLNLWLSAEGFFLRPGLLFRSFHPPLLIPWSAVSSVTEEKIFLSRWTIVECEAGDISFTLEVPGRHRAEFSQYVPLANRLED